jgi:hypothetical protein
MRKRLLALLSLAGLASSSTPGTSQVLKGSSAGPETKNESQVKDDKVKQENAAVKDDASKTMRKAGGEQQANKDVVTEKVGPDADAASKDAAKMTKARAENTANHKHKIKKVKWITGESNAVQNEAGKKYRKAGKEQDALTVKQKATAHQNLEKRKHIDKASPK